MNGRFLLNRGEGKIMGVAAGLADYTGVDATPDPPWPGRRDAAHRPVDDPALCHGRLSSDPGAFTRHGRTRRPDCGADTEEENSAYAPAMIATSLPLACLAAPAAAALPVGAKAPEFVTTGAIGGKAFKLDLERELRKGPVVLYFYPKAFTKGCTLEAHAFSEAAPNSTRPAPK